MSSLSASRWAALGLLVCAAALGAHGSESQSARALRSTLIYPPQRIGVRMNHALPAHAALRCERCHVGATDSTRAADSLLPTEASCSPCHESQTDRRTASEGNCGYCHAGYQDGDDVLASAIPTARLHFSHQQHARAQVGCVSCHDVQGSEMATRAHLPTMQQCRSCHAERGADNECATCHFTQPDGRLRTRYPEGVMNPPSTLAGMNHDADFLVRHRWVGADHGDACASCHEESDCADCHDGRVRDGRVSVHENDYLTTHPQEARRDNPRCASCHTVQRFCTECHARIGVAPIAAPSVIAGSRVHPPAAMWEAQHGIEAKRSMTACASCHVERDCVQCHGAAGIGLGVSPHPAGFASRCASAVRQNPRACVTCHGDVADLCR